MQVGHEVEISGCLKEVDHAVFVFWGPGRVVSKHAETQEFWYLPIRWFLKDVDLHKSLLMESLLISYNFDGYQASSFVIHYSELLAQNFPFQRDVQRECLVTKVNWSPVTIL